MWVQREITPAAAPARLPPDHARRARGAARAARAARRAAARVHPPHVGVADAQRERLARRARRLRDLVQRGRARGRAATGRTRSRAPDDMPAHIKASLLGPSLTLPVSGGGLAHRHLAGHLPVRAPRPRRRALADPHAQRRVTASTNSVSAGSRSPRSSARSTSTQASPRDSASTRACGLTVCAARTPRQAALRRVEPDALQVARELLDGVDRPHALDLDRDPAVLGVAAHEVHRPDVRRPLAANEPEPLAAEVRARRPARPAGRPRRRPCSSRSASKSIAWVTSETTSCSVISSASSPLTLRTVIVSPLLDDRRRRGHPVQRLVAAGVGVDEHGAVGLEHDQPQRLRQVGGQTAGVVDGAAGDDQAHTPPSVRDRPDTRRPRARTLRRTDGSCGAAPSA